MSAGQRTEPMSEPRVAAAPHEAGLEDAEATSVLSYWLGDARRARWDRAYFEEREALWWSGTPAVDAEIGVKFGALLQREADALLRGEVKAGAAPHSRALLARIIVVDQFSRSVFRGRAEAYALDAVARRLCLDGLERGVDGELCLVERVFLSMPLEHSEDRALQERSVAYKARLWHEARRVLPAELHRYYESYHEWAVKHRDAIVAFGRFPHRNAALGRPSTPDERRFLEVRHGFL
jgi:uncharacterized protein (DUF924 family)